MSGVEDAMKPKEIITDDEEDMGFGNNSITHHHNSSLPEISGRKIKGMNNFDTMDPDLINTKTANSNLKEHLKVESQLPKIDDKFVSLDDRKKVDSIEKKKKNIKKSKIIVDKVSRIKGQNVMGDIDDDVYNKAIENAGNDEAGGDFEQNFKYIPTK